MMRRFSFRLDPASIQACVMAVSITTLMYACQSPQKSIHPSGFHSKISQTHPEPEVTRIDVPQLLNPPTHYNNPKDRHPPRSNYQKNMYRRVELLAQKHKQKAPAYDSRLSFAADVIAEAADTIKHRPVELVYFALARQGIVENDFFQRIFRISGELDQHNEALDGMLENVLTIQGCDQIGFGSRINPDETRLGVILCQPRLVETSPIPRRLDKNASVAVRAKLLPPYGQPRVYVTEPTGRVHSIEVHPTTGSQFSFRFHCGLKAGRYRIEILGYTNDCPVVAANFPIWCEQEPRQTFSMKLPPRKKRPSSTPQEIEKNIFKLINQDRKRHHLTPLSWHPEAAEIARLHSRDMELSGKIGHHSDSSGTPLDRAQKAGLQFGFLAENIGSGVSDVEIHHGLMESPGHRQAILSTQASHVGIGAVLSKRSSNTVSVLVTELFIGPISDLAPPKPTAIKSKNNQPIDIDTRILQHKKKLESCRILGMSRKIIQVSSEKDLDSAQETATRALRNRAKELGADTVKIESKLEGLKLTLEGHFYGCRQDPQ